MNDPVYVEAAQALGRRMAQSDGDLAQKLRFGFRLCVARPPHPSELKRLQEFYLQTKEAYAKDPVRAKTMASEPPGNIPEGFAPAEMAAWSAMGNVLLNLDELLMKP
jgi:hypothetical protein